MKKKVIGTYLYFILVVLIIVIEGCNNEEVTIPVLTTSAITDITQTSASGSGAITSNGGASVTACGLCWSTSQNPTITDSMTTGNLNNGILTGSLTGLNPGTTYYVRTFATNSAGTAYGSEMSFKTQDAQVPVLNTSPISDITQYSATGGGTVTSEGSSPVTICGICWSINQNPTISDSKTSDNFKTTFSSNITGLNPKTIYYVRSYATSRAGTGYGNQVVFTTNGSQIPVLTTYSIGNITQTSATCGGTIISESNVPVIAYGFIWYKDQTPALSYNKTSSNLNNGTFTADISDLSPNTTYYVKAYATNSSGTGYGNEISFKTQSAVVVNKKYHVYVDFECGEALSPSDRPNIYVIWMENETTSFLQNIFICKKLIYGGLTGTALPYWKVNKYPLSSADEVDAVTSATVANKDFTVSAVLKDSTVKNFKLYFEIDHSFDPNDWFSNQPALLYEADINLNDTLFELAPIGWTPNEDTENLIPSTPMGKLENEMRYITNLKDGSSFGAVDSRSSTNMVKKISVRIE